MGIENLDFGYLLMRRRARLEALAAWLTSDSEQAGVAVRCTLCAAWWMRSRIACEEDLDPFLLADLRGKVESGQLGCALRAPTCPRTTYYASLDAHA